MTKEIVQKGSSDQNQPKYMVAQTSSGDSRITVVSILAYGEHHSQDLIFTVG